MFSNMLPNANAKFTRLMFNGNARGMASLSQEANELNDSVIEFYTHFLEKMNGIDKVLNNISSDKQMMDLLEEQKREGFTQAVVKFQQTYQKVAAINKVHGGTTFAKLLKIQERVENLIKVLGGSQNEVWQGLCASLISVRFYLTRTVDNLSFLNN